MNYEEAFKKWRVRRGNKNENLARSLLKVTKRDIQFFNKLEMNEESARKLVSNYYDCLRSILEAMAALDGYKIYGHELFFNYLKKKKENNLATKFDRFREIRNRINYYGEDIDVQQAKEVVGDIKTIINYLIKRYLKGV